MTVGSETVAPTSGVVGGTPGNPVYGIKGGLTKREYFAALAMQAIVGTMSKNFDISSAVSQATKIADQLIAELNK